MAFDRAKADMESVFQEGTELELTGKFDQHTAKNIEARLQAISERLDKDVANIIDEIRASASTRPKPTTQIKVAAIFFLLASIGLPLEFTLGESFVFAYTNAYKSLLPLIFFVTLPMFALLWFHLERTQHALSSRSPTWGVRWLLVFPLIVVFSASIVAFSPFGWSALAGWAFGSTSESTEAKVISVGDIRSRVGKCDQKASIDIDQAKVSICLEDRVLGATPKPGDTVIILGRRSPLGLFIEEIRRK